jgi:adenosylhomocysteine nucleosidase
VDITSLAMFIDGDYGEAPDQSALPRKRSSAAENRRAGVAVMATREPVGRSSCERYCGGARAGRRAPATSDHFDVIRCRIAAGTEHWACHFMTMSMLTPSAPESASAEPHVIAVTSLAFEAQVARRGGVTVLCHGRREELRERVRCESERARGLISFGVAGGLDRTLRPGDWIIGACVVTDTGRHDTDAGWARRLCDALPAARLGDISGQDAPIASPAAKLTLRRAHGTIAVDNESHIVAEVAVQRRIPFAVARVVLDPAWRTLPPAALEPLNPDGTADLLAVIRSIVRAPHQLAGLGMVTVDAYRAWSGLRLGCVCLGPALGFPHVAVAEEAAGVDTDDGDEMEPASPWAAAI